MDRLLKETQAYRLIQRESEENTLSHAYLLLFNDGRNLKAALKLFAAELFTLSNEDEESERIQKLIEEESYADCLFFPEDGKKLTVDDAEKIREESLLSPIEGNKKVFVLGDFAEANPQTQNKLLKLLEEPPKGVIFLLGATSAFSILPTVLSRTKKLEILPFDVKAVTDTLYRIYGKKYDKETLALCAATSGGIVGEAQNILEGGYHKNLSENAFALCLCEEARLPVIVKNIGETKYKKELLSLLRLIFRDALLIKTGEKTLEQSVLLQSEKERLKEVADGYTLDALIYAQTAISKAELQVQFNAVFPQCIEICMANIRAK